MHTCPMVTGIVPHVGGPVLPPGVPTVLIDFLPAANVTTMATCVGPPDIIVKGSAGVFINFLPAARMGDLTAHGGVIVLGSPTCIIGEVGAPSPGAGGLSGIVAGLVSSGVVNPMHANASVFSSPGAGAGASSPAGSSAVDDTPLSRMKTAQQFYKDAGFSDEKIKQHLRGIDFSSPVEVMTLEPQTVVNQWVDPNSGMGSYFDADAPPEELGVCPVAVVPRNLQAFVVTQPTKVLRSTAAPIVIDWLPRPPVFAKGGATQLFVAPKDKANFVPIGGGK